MDTGSSDQYVKFLVGNNVIEVDRVRLCQASPYFEIMFAPGKFREETDEAIRLTVPEWIDSSAILALVYHVTTDDFNLVISEKNAEKYFAAAVYLQFEQIAEQCIEALRNAIKLDNACRIWTLANAHNQSCLKNAALDVVVKNFDELSLTSEFLECSEEALRSVFRHEELTVASEKDLYKVVIAWCRFDTESRWNEETLNAVLSELDWNQLADIATTLAVTAVEPLSSCILKLSATHSPRNASVDRSLLAKKRNARKFILFFHALKVTFGHELYLQLYDPQWGTLRQLQLPQAFHDQILECCVKLDSNEILYKCKAYESSSKCDACAVDVVKGTSQCLPIVDTVLFRRTYSPVVVADKLYGFDREDSSKFMRIDLTSGEAVALPAPNVPRKNFSTAVFQDRIYYFGGSDVARQVASHSVDIFSTTTSTWTKGPDMLESRCDSAVVVLGNKIYVMGGRNNSNNRNSWIIKSCECMDLKTGTWKKIANLRQPRLEHGAFIRDGKPCVVGGSTHAEPLRTMEEYDEENDVWNVVNMGMIMESDEYSSKGRRQYTTCLEVEWP